jgi:diaminohydroxyphosphoribosylaminopyrimidine deaminase/5-amino-6-(5-phosphoribosylamino)uracil reductase
MTSLELMQLALAAARESPRAVRPNPKVGAALLTSDGKSLAARHEVFGGPHAEVRLAEEAKKQGLSLVGATVAVTLEPCAHFGKTPPCADLLIREKVAKVVVGLQDPFAQVAGRGLEKLKAAGIEVEMSPLSGACEALNREWLFAHRHKRAHVTLKMATSLDGKFFAADGKSQWITGPEARVHAHRHLRTRVDAILTSFATVKADDPLFSARDAEGKDFPSDKQPKVFVLSRSAPQDLSKFKIAKRAGGAAQWLQLASFEKSLQDLYAQGIFDVMVEAGPALSSAFLESGFVDEVCHYVAASYVGGEQSSFAPLAGGSLPALGFSLEALEQLSETDFFLRLQRK